MRFLRFARNDGKEGRDCFVSFRFARSDGKGEDDFVVQITIEVLLKKRHKPPSLRACLSADREGGTTDAVYTEM